MPFKKKEKAELVIQPEIISAVTRAIETDSIASLMGTPNAIMQDLDRLPVITNESSTVIHLKPASKKMQGVYTLVPAESTKMPGRFAVEEEPDFLEVMKDCGLTRKDLLKYRLSITEKGLVFNLDNPFDKFNYYLCKHNSMCSEGEVYSNTLFVFVNNKRETEEKLSVYQKKVEANTLLYGMNDKERKDILRLYGRNVNDIAARDATLLLCQFIDDDAGKFLKYATNKELKTMKYIYEAMENGYIAIERGIYKYGDLVIGKSIDEAVAWCKSKDNREIIDSITIQMSR